MTMYSYRTAQEWRCGRRGGLCCPICASSTIKVSFLSVYLYAVSNVHTNEWQSGMRAFSFRVRIQMSGSDDFSEQSYGKQVFFFFFFFCQHFCSVPFSQLYNEFCCTAWHKKWKEMLLHLILSHGNSHEMYTASLRRAFVASTLVLLICEIANMKPGT